MKTILANLGLDTISPEWMFVAAVLFFVLGCIEILALLIDNLPHLVSSISREPAFLQGRGMRTLISLTILPASFMLASGVCWVLFNS